MHDLADFDRGIFQPIDAGAGGLGGQGGAFGQMAGFVNLAHDVARRRREFFGCAGQLDGVFLGAMGFAGEFFAALANVGERLRRGLHALTHRAGSLVHVADHGREIGFQEVDGFADGVDAALVR
jgi:hypothetical protein